MMFATLIALLPALATAAPRPRTNSKPKLYWDDCLANIPQSIDPNITSVPSTLKCGHVMVPMDYTRPMSSKNSLNVSFSLNAVNSSLGLLAYNPGGPGEEVRSAAWQLAGVPLDGINEAAELEVFDFLAIDIRGSFASNPLNCSTDRYPVPFAPPSTEDEFNAVFKNVTAFARDCAANSLPKGILDHLGTDEIAEDFNAVREALGYKSMSYFGYSYGTVYGQELVRRHPDKLSRVILDAVASVRASTLEYSIEAGRTTDLMLERADAYCRNISCPLETQGVPEAYGQLLASTDVNRTKIVPNVPSLSYIYGLAGAVHFPWFIDALSAHAQGNDTAFEVTPDLSEFWTNAVYLAAPTFCPDRQHEDPTWQGYNSIMQAVANSSQYGRIVGPEFIMTAICPAWTARKSNLLSQSTDTDFPLLLVTSNFDYNIPTNMTDEVRAHMPNATLISRHGDDHGSLYVPGPVRDMELAYLINGTMPQSSQEELYAVYAPGEVRAENVDPYAVPVGLVAGDGL